MGALSAETQMATTVDRKCKNVINLCLNREIIFNSEIYDTIHSPVNTNTLVRDKSKYTAKRLLYSLYLCYCVSTLEIPHRIPLFYLLAQDGCKLLPVQCLLTDCSISHFKYSEGVPEAKNVAKVVPDSSPPRAAHTERTESDRR